MLSIVNVALIAMLLWAVMMNRAPVATPAQAGFGAGIPDAASQRLQMIQELRDLNQGLEELRKQLEKSEIKVKVTSMPQVPDEAEPGI